MDAVDTSTLEKTIANLATALDFLAKASTPGEQWVARNSAVLEFTLCWARVRPSLERALVRLDALDPDDVKAMSFAALIRAAFERGYTTSSGSTGTGSARRATLPPMSTGKRPRS